MTSVKESSVYFLRRVREQALKNRIEYNLKCNIFEKIDHTEYTVLNNFYNTRHSAWDRNIIDDSHSNYAEGYLEMDFLGPKDYPWKNDTKCHFLIDYIKYLADEYILALPDDWAHWYDPTTPVFIYDSEIQYLDFEKQKCASYSVFLVRGTFFPCIISPPYHFQCQNTYIPKKCDRDWCVTYLNIFNFSKSIYFYYNFESILLLKNIDFSEFDAKVEAKDTKCSERKVQGLKIKKKPQFVFHDYWLDEKNGNHVCICTKCRKNCRAIQVSLKWSTREVRVWLNVLVE